MKNENNHKPVINNKEIELVKDKSSGYFKVEKNKEDYKDKFEKKIKEEIISNYKKLKVSTLSALPTLIKECLKK